MRIFALSATLALAPAQNASLPGQLIEEPTTLRFSGSRTASPASSRR